MEKETLNLNDLKIMFSRTEQIHFREKVFYLQDVVHGLVVELSQMTALRSEITITPSTAAASSS